MTARFHPCALTIAGSDSGGNAGVQADLRAFHAYGVHGCTVFAALTAQNPFSVTAIHEVPADFVAAQLDAVLGTYAIGALKTGMLSSAAVMEVVANRLERHPEIQKVVDPVMVATSGAKLIADEAIMALTERLLPLATLITPNLPEAELLAGGTLDSSARSAGADHAEELARELQRRFGCAVLVKGGHGEGDAAVDVLYDGMAVRRFAMPRIMNPVSTHGTGCSLAAALAAELALGNDVPAAVAGAKTYVHEAVRRSYLVGENCGVLGFATRADIRQLTAGSLDANRHVEKPTA